MKITTVLFDLDGTLLPMDFDVFVKAYFDSITAHLAGYGYDPEAVRSAVWAGMRTMFANDGSRLNEEAFWAGFEASFVSRGDDEAFETYYHDVFDGVAESCGYTPDAKRTVDYLRERGMRLVLATNPAFPSIATEKRMRWAGVEPTDFELYTTFENAHFCKPTLGYYREILQTLGVSAEECLMVGNDVDDDMVAEQIGMNVFLLDPWLINRRGVDLTRYPRGGYAELMEYLAKISEKSY